MIANRLISGNGLPGSSKDEDLVRRIGVVVKAAIESVGSVAKAASEAGVGPDQLARWRDGKTTPNFVGMGRLAVISGYSLTWIITGRDEAGRSSDDDAQALHNEPPEGFALIPRLDVQASAGNGALVDVEDEEEVLAFRADWLRKRGINPATAHMLTARGDSMEPTIRDGDELIVDTSIDQVVDNAIYIVVFAGRTLVKRVQIKRSGDIVLRSDNKELFDEETVPAAEVPDINVAGRVMWYGRNL